MNIQHCLHRLENSAATLTFLEAEGAESIQSYAGLYRSALLLLGGLQRAGVRPGRHVLLRLRGVRAHVTALWACWLGDIVPVSIPGANPSDSFSALLKARHDHPAVLTDRPEAAQDPDALFYPSLMGGEEGSVQPMRDQDPALLQYTSGTTSLPRCAVLTGANLYEGALASSVIVRPGVRERYLNWLPLSHIFGLVGNHLVPLYNGFDQYLMDTGRFVSDPVLWMQKSSAFRATVSGSSLFGLDLAARSADRLDPENTDLSSMYVCFCGGEDLKPAVLENFENRLAPFGWKPGVLRPAYGLSEATMGVCYNPPGAPMRIHRIHPASVGIGQKLRFVDSEDGQRLTRVALGVLDDCNDVEVRGLAGDALPEEHLGIIHIKGTNVMAGYWRPEEGAPPNPDAQGWLDTGDLGYFKDGWLTVFSRYKDVVCYHGANYVRTDLEQTAREAVGRGTFAIVEAGGTLMLFADSVDLADLCRAGNAVSEAWGVPVSKGVLLPGLPRTAKGGVDRLALSVQWEQGAFAEDVHTLYREGEATLPGPYGAMAALWSRLLALPHRAISMDSHFVALGGDSLVLIDLACAIEEQWGIFVETDELAAAATLREMAELIGARRKDKASGPAGA